MVSTLSQLWYQYCSLSGPIFVLGLMNLLSVLPLISIAITPKFDLVHLNVTVGEVNGSLSLAIVLKCLIRIYSNHPPAGLHTQLVSSFLTVVFHN